MAREHLSEELKVAGQKLLAMTDALDMQAQGAMWIHSPVLNDWRFYLVTSLVDAIGRKRTYRLLLDAFEKLSLPEAMTVEDVYLGSPSDELFQRISSAVRAENTAVEFANCVFNDVRFDGLMYRSIKEVPTEQQAHRIEKRFEKRVKDLTTDGSI